MNAHRLALYLASRSLLYFQHVIGHMPVDAVDIFVPDGLLLEGKATCPAYRELADTGYQFFPVGQAGGRYGAVGVAGQQDLERHPALASLADRRILMLHASAFVFMPDDAPFTHILCQYAKQINLGKQPEAPANGKLLREIHPAGTYQLGPWEDGRRLPRERLRQLLEEHLDARIPADRELVLYCGGLNDNPQEQVDAVRQLAAARTVLFKPFYDHPDYDGLTGHPGVHAIRDTVHISPNAMRFAADCIVTSPLSGVFTTSLMLRLRVLPFLTYHQSSRQDRNDFATWRQRIPPNSPRPDFHIARKLEGPFDNKTLPDMVKRMGSPYYWQGYDAMLRALLPAFFGDCRIEGAAERAAGGLLNVARCGTFTPDGRTETA
ncbi:hypothetical protein [uncultured Desulfovibrio sp.]|uniref:hypothetical protein n=1 Tax=uncultured Desulfovibrio sp. TaxID=167968 RepID=UPI00260E020E|nr:hypothetical protein [uncultured Desulfovibrio sp.]